MGSRACVILSGLTAASLVEEKKSLVALEVSCLEDNGRGGGPFMVTTVHLIIMRSGLSKADLNEEKYAHGSQRAICTP